MLFYKVRQISTGLFFDGGRCGFPKFTAHGARYETATPCKAARTYFGNLRRAAERWLQEFPDNEREAEKVAFLRPEDFEIVQFEETETAVIK